nr:immunoglobulin light chain junction region [Macaca mulatta]MPN65250.1 immunoglobulin light chain junction region [Macaca mulatta]MPN65261.1 immunoglobulin light chain junction region [Macaca mulatta]MPN65329.1 immunoglobulin light chain junction region [Macaca mulatta]MPN65336.1 immunoglobulin light chain junction region [Macaca mulatta]
CSAWDSSLSTFF